MTSGRKARHYCGFSWLRRHVPVCPSLWRAWCGLCAPCRFLVLMASSIWQMYPFMPHLVLCLPRHLLETQVLMSMWLVDQRILHSCSLDFSGAVFPPVHIEKPVVLLFPESQLLDPVHRSWVNWMYIKSYLHGCHWLPLEQFCLPCDTGM